MLLKRMFPRNAAGELTSKVPNGVRIMRLPKNGKQNFSPKLIKQGQEHGWLTADDKKIVITCVDAGKVTFNIKSGIRRECLHCGEVLPGVYEDQSGIVARRHVEEKHAGKKSKDKRWPGGYLVQNYIATEVEK